MALSEKWHQRYYELAEHVSQWSKDQSTKVGSVIVDSETNRIISIGYNGFPRGINDDLPERHERPLKYEYAEHAERNAIYNADQSLRGTIIYVTFPPCTDCVRGIIQTGIKTVVCKRPDFSHERWGDKWKLSFDMLEEAGIEIIYLAEKVESIIGDQRFYSGPPTEEGEERFALLVIEPSFAAILFKQEVVNGELQSEEVQRIEAYVDPDNGLNDFINKIYNPDLTNQKYERYYMKYPITGDIERIILEQKRESNDQ